MTEWREQHSVEVVREHYASSTPGFTVIEQATGGCLDTMSAALAGFKHVGGTEDVSKPLGRAKARLFCDMTLAPCLGDARDWRRWAERFKPGQIDYYKAGMPCTNYASLGDREGELGNKGGELFVTQAETILTLRPKTFRLEMVPTALETNGGREVECVIAGLSHHYHVDARVLDCWRYGDPTSRRRLMIVGGARDIVQAEWYQWPEPICDETWYPTARDVAIPDNEVPSQYWFDPETSGQPLTFPSDRITPEPGKLQHIGYAGTPAQRLRGDAGHSSRPHNIQGWDGLWATQMATNGGSRRPHLDWQPGQPMGRARMTTPRESCRVASVNEESYLAFSKKHYSKKELGMTYDQWVRELVNLGVPLMTGIAIDMEIRHSLERAGVNVADPLKSASTYAFNPDLKRCDKEYCDGPDCDYGLIDPLTTNWVMVSEKMKLHGEIEDRLEFTLGDTGASGSVSDASTYNPHLKNPRPSKSTFSIAGNGSIRGDLEGEIQVSVLNLESQPYCPDIIEHEFTTTTVKDLGHETLVSLDEHFRSLGYDVILSHGYRKGDRTGLYRPPEAHAYGPESYLPLVYNYQGRGGWRLPYVIRRRGVSEESHQRLLTSILDQHHRVNSKEAKKLVKRYSYDTETAAMVERECWAYPSVSSSVSVQMPGDRNIRPAFTFGGLRRHKAKNVHEFHSIMGHLGDTDGHPCPVCVMYKGSARHRPKHREGTPRESRPGCVWHMDMIVFPERSEEGCKYCLVLTDECTQAIQILPLYWKSDAVYEVRRWITCLRSHPAYRDITYTIVSKIVTDNESVWDEDASEWEEMLRQVNSSVEHMMEYADPADHARDNARAEAKNNFIEAGLCSILYEANLPKSWWQRAASDFMFLANRICTYSDEASAPPNQDLPSPIERLFHGYVSRHQVYRELDNYVRVGTPALCHLPKVKKNTLEPRVRWGIAIGIRGKVVKWECPFSGVRFRNRSFQAFHLRRGLNYSQFLGLGDIAPGPQSRMLPQDTGVKWTIELPEVRPNSLKLPPPVEAATLSIEGRNAYAEITPNDSSDLCEYFPKVKAHRHRANPLPVFNSRTVEHDDGMDDADEDESLRPMTVEFTGGKHILTPDEARDMEAEQGDDDVDNGELPLDGFHASDPTMTLPDDDDDINEYDDEENDHVKQRGKRRKVETAQEKTIKRKQRAATRQSRKRLERKVTSRNRELEHAMDDVVEVMLDDEAIKEENELEEHEAREVRKYGLTTDGHMSWGRVCKTIHSRLKELPHHLHNTYRLWLLTKPLRSGEEQLFVENLPRQLCESKASLQAGLKLPYPSGPHWNNLVANGSYKRQLEAKLELEEVEEEQTYQAMRVYMRALQDRNHPAIAMMCKALVAEQATPRELEEALNVVVTDHVTDLKLNGRVARKALKNKRMTVAEQADPAPANMITALMSDRSEEWVESIYKEFNGLMSQGVFSGPWTKEQLRQQGITSRPVPCSTCLTHKFKDSKLEKLKTRICIAGHKGNVTKGIHYHEVFAASPVQHTERMLQALMINLHLENLAWDIRQAYTWSKLPAGERVAVEYPTGFKKEDPATGEPLYLILERNLYGMPSAGRGWAQTRDKFITEYFNRTSSVWCCAQCIHDPCLFVIDKYKSIESKCATLRRRDKHESPRVAVDINDLPDGAHRTWILIHTDDCDAYGTSLDVLHEINDVMNKEWQTEIVDREVILGVKRTLDRTDPDNWKVHLTMTAFIDDLVSLFSHDLEQVVGRGKYKIPFPENLILTKSDTPDEGEVERNITRGYQRLVGSLLWVVRHVLPVCAYGCSQLCKLMSTPTDVAWKAALHMLQYIKQHRATGITFSEIHEPPIAFVDASNKDDPTDGKTQYGYLIHWGGPLIAKSGKLSHVGINSTYNEYMALHHCIKQVVWLRQLMDESGVGSLCSKPTVVYADNRQANNLCGEDLVTAGNMYFRTGYHYNKEAVADGYCEVSYVHTSWNLSDAMTKALGSNKISFFSPYINGEKPVPDKKTLQG